jgi:hypothetical protein
MRLRQKCLRKTNSCSVDPNDKASRYSDLVHAPAVANDNRLTGEGAAFKAR